MKFHAEDFSLDNTSQSSRSTEVDGNRIKILTEKSQHYTMQEIDDILKISKSLKLLVKIKNVFYCTEKTKQALANPIIM